MKGGGREGRGEGEGGEGQRGEGGTERGFLHIFVMSMLLEPFYDVLI
jgi:hypothetical protein